MIGCQGDAQHLRTTAYSNWKGTHCKRKQSHLDSTLSLGASFPCHAKPGGAQQAEACLQEDVKRLRVLADRAAGVTKDKVAARDALALGRQLAQLDATPEQVPQFKLRARVLCLW